MSAKFDAMTHGLQGFELVYLLMLAAIVAGIIHGRGSWSKLLWSPLIAAPTLVVASIVSGALNSLLGLIGIGDVLQVLFGVMMCLLAGYFVGRQVAARHRTARGPEHRRGATVMSSETDPSVSSGGSSRQRLPGDPITLAGIPIPLEDEAKHFKLIGTTGTGKSTAIRELLSGALSRGDRAIIADPDGGYVNRFYDPSRGDVILNPFHSKARKWDLFGEISTDYDINQLARSLIPNGSESDRVWCEFARTFFAAVTKQAIRAGNKNDSELFRLLTSAEPDELRLLLAGTPAGQFLAEGNEKMFGSLRSVVIAAVQALEYTTQQKAEPFSVRKWVREGAAKHAGGPGGVLFIPYSAGQIAALRSVISAWMRLAIFEAMDRGEADQRLWFTIDELDALGEIDGLKDALARLRKFGGRCILGMQSIGQMSGTYGRSSADTIVENCGNTLIFRCSASEHGGTAEFASKLIGQREVLHTTTAKSRRFLQALPSTTTSQHLKIEPAVMASEIERLPDLAGFLKIASVPDWQRVRLTPRGASERAQPVKESSVTEMTPGTSVLATSSPAINRPKVPRDAAKATSKRPRQPRAARKRSPAATESARSAPASLPISVPAPGDGGAQSAIGGVEPGN